MAQRDLEPQRHVLSALFALLMLTCAVAVVILIVASGFSGA